jgi:hypothetical protein
MRLLLLLLILVICVPDHAFQQLPPLIPAAFSADFVEYTAPETPPPPYENGQPSAPFLGSRGDFDFDSPKLAPSSPSGCTGTVHYDWSTLSMYAALRCLPFSSCTVTHATCWRFGATTASTYFPLATTFLALSTM